MFIPFALYFPCNYLKLESCISLWQICQVLQKKVHHLDMTTLLHLSVHHFDCLISISFLWSGFVFSGRPVALALTRAGGP